MIGRKVILPVVLLGYISAAPAPAQELDTVIYFPDSMGYCYQPEAVLVNPLTNRVYVASTGMLVFDPANRTKERFFRGTWTGGIFCPGVNKIYLAGDMELGVVDGNNDQLQERIAVDFTPGVMAYSRTSAKLYVADEDEGFLYVYDARTDTLVRVVELADYPVWAGWDSLTNRLLLGEEATVEILDCATDSVVEGRALAAQAWDYVLHPLGRKLYCAQQSDTIIVLNADSLTTITQIGPISYPYSLAYNPVLNRVYCRGYYGVTVIDGRADTIRRFIPLEYPNGLVASTVSGKVYVTNDYASSTIMVIGAEDTVTTTLVLSGPPQVSAFSPGRNELNCALRTDRIAIVDCSSDTLAGYMEYPQFIIRGLVHNPAGNKLYLIFPERDTVMALDREFRVVRQIAVTLHGTDIFPILNPALNRLYLADSGTLWVIDCNRDEVMGGHALSGLVAVQTAILIPTMNKLYIFPRAARQYRVWVYDCLRDTTRYLQIGDEVGCAAFHPWSNRLYFQTDSDDSIWLIDPVADTFAGKLWAGRFYRHNEMLANFDNGMLYHVRNYGTNKIFTIDVRNNTVLDSVGISDDGDTIFWFRPRNKLYLCDRSPTGDVKVFDCSSGQVIDTLELPCVYAGALNEATGRLFLGDDSGIVVLDCWSDSVLARLPGSYRPHYSAYDPIDNRLFFARRANWLAVYSDRVGIEEEPAAVCRLRLELGANPVRGRTSFRLVVPAGRKALLKVFDIAGRLLWQEKLTGSGRISALAWPPEGQAIVSGIYFIRLESGRMVATAKLVLE